MDTFKFLHHTLPTPTVSDTHRINKAMQQLKLTIEGKRDAPADELGAIQHLRALITGAANTPMVEEPESVPEPEQAIPVPGPIHECAPEPLPAYLVTQPTPTPPDTTAPQPHQIPFDDNKYEQPSLAKKTYNLRSRAVNVIQSAITTTDNNTNPRPTIFLVHTILDEETGKILEYRQLAKQPKYKEEWTKSYANELGRLTQGIQDIPGTNTMFFIPKEEIPPERRKDVTFGKIVTDYHPQKSEPNQSHLTVVRTYIEYPWDVATPTSDLVTAKLLFNSVISTPRASFIEMDIKNFYLNTPMDRPKYVKLKLDIIPDER
jgi:hypothetical protein